MSNKYSRKQEENKEDVMKKLSDEQLDQVSGGVGFEELTGLGRKGYTPEPHSAKVTSHEPFK